MSRYDSQKCKYGLWHRNVVDLEERRALPAKKRFVTVVRVHAFSNSRISQDDVSAGKPRP